MNTELILEEAFSISAKDILNNRVFPGINYWVEKSDDETAVFICPSGQEPKKFGLEPAEITFGTRFYLRCGCGSRISKIYLPLNGNSFVCKRCGKLQYFLTTINKNSIAGQKLYRMNRFQKLAESRAGMRKILHAGRFSRRFESFLRQCDRAGLQTIVQGAQELKTLLAG